MFHFFLILTQMVSIEFRTRYIDLPHKNKKKIINKNDPYNGVNFGEFIETFLKRVVCGSSRNDDNIVLLNVSELVDKMLSRWDITTGKKHSETAIPVRRFFLLFPFVLPLFLCLPYRSTYRVNTSCHTLVKHVLSFPRHPSVSTTDRDRVIRTKLFCSHRDKSYEIDF